MVASFAASLRLWIIALTSQTCHVYHLRQPYGRSSLGDYDGQATTLTKMNGMLEHDKRAHQKKVARTSSTQMSPNQHPIP